MQISKSSSRPMKPMVAGDVLDEVEGVIVLEVGASDLHDVPGLDLHVVLIGHG